MMIKFNSNSNNIRNKETAEYKTSLANQSK